MEKLTSNNMDMLGLMEGKTVYKSDEVIYLKKYDILTSPGEYILMKGYLACKTEKHLVYFAQQGDRVIVHTNFYRGLLQYQAKSDMVLVRMPEERPIVMLERSEALTKKLMVALIMRIQFFSIPVKERLNALLYQLGKEIGVEAEGGCYLPPVLTQKEVGEYISCTREYLCVLRRQLVEEGWIDKEKGWKLLDWDRWEKRWGKNTAQVIGKAVEFSGD